jgi:glycosyltransferase involved in cell wall biosynthesis
MRDRKMPKVSILIPCYNAEQWIGQAIQSALDQTWPDKEVIVVDDGSIDGSREVIQSFEGRVKFEFAPNRGGNPTRNRLLELASGDWVQYLDADDYLLPNKINHQIQSVDEQVDVVYGPIIIQNESAQAISHTLSQPDAIQDLAEQWIRWHVCQTGGVLWRRESLLKIGGWNESFSCCQDNEVCLRAIKKGLKFRYSEYQDTVYRIWSEDTVCRKDPRRVISIKSQLIQEMLDILRKNQQIKKAHISAAGEAIFEMSRTLAKSSINEASQYAQTWRNKGIFRASGPAAPLSFQVMMKLLGYTNAERIAKLTRKQRKQ